MMINSSNSEKTIYTGDKIQGVDVISQLNVSDLEPGQKYRFYFQGVQMGSGQHWYVPLIIAKGATDGKRIATIAGVHGDELSPIDAVRRIMENLDPAQMSGTVIAVCGVSRPALEYARGTWPSSQFGGSSFDINRVWPGDENGNNIATRHAAILWNRLFKNNTDIALDYHTVSSGSEFTMFIYADCRNQEIHRIASLFPCEQIKDDPGLEGTLETAFVAAGIPAITIEIGAARIFDYKKIAIAVEGTLNVFNHYQVIEGEMGQTSKEAATFFGDRFETIRSTHGGFLEILVDLREKLVAGQKVARQRNAFGDIVAEYSTSVTGEVATIARDALSEPGSRIMQILYQTNEEQ